jgi:hypothetical protein
MNSSLINNVQDDIRIGVLSFKAIANKYGITTSDVNLVWDQLCETEFAEDENLVEGFNNYRDYE